MRLRPSEMGTTNTRLHAQLRGMWEEIAQLRYEIEVIRSENQTDALTSLGNRKFFNSALESSVAQAHDAKEALTLLLADVDHFQEYQRHALGTWSATRVLRFVAMTLKKNLKGSDIAARYGGEEFAIILPRTPVEAAVNLAEQLRQAVMKGELVKQSTGEKHSALTISIGVAILHEGASAQSLVEAADVCLYAAKRSGRNCVVSETDEKQLDAVTR